MNEPTIETLTRRLEWVERENRRLKLAAGKAIGMTLVGGERNSIDRTKRFVYYS